MRRSKEVSQDDMMRALLYLREEALRDDMPQVAEMIEAAIESCQKVKNSAAYATLCGDTLKQFYVIRGFLKLNDVQKQVFIQAIQDSQDSLQECSSVN